MAFNHLFDDESAWAGPQNATVGEQDQRDLDDFLQSGTPPEILDALVNDDHRMVDDWCHGIGINAAEFQWLASSDELPSEMQPLAEWYFSRRTPGLPDAAAITPDQLRGFLGDLMLLDVQPESDEFSYRLYGSNIADRTGFDLTGRTTRDLAKLRLSAAKIFHLSYKAVAGSGRVLYMEYEARNAPHVSNWRRLVLPFAVGGGTEVRRLMVLNLAQSSQDVPGDVLMFPIW